MGVARGVDPVMEGPRGVVGCAGLVGRKGVERIGLGWEGAVGAEGRGGVGGGSVTEGGCGGRGRLGSGALLPWTDTGVGFTGLV